MVAIVMMPSICIERRVRSLQGLTCARSPPLQKKGNSKYEASYLYARKVSTKPLIFSSMFPCMISFALNVCEAMGFLPASFSILPRVPAGQRL